MGFLFILIVIGVIVAIANGMQKNRYGRSMPPFGGPAHRPLETYETSPNANSDKSEPLRPRHAIEEAEEGGGWKDIMQNAVRKLPDDFDREPIPTDALQDFGDTEEIDDTPLIVERERVYFKPSMSVTNNKKGSVKLDLKPTQKKLAETFILGECFGEPRARRPFSPVRYLKK